MGDWADEPQWDEFGREDDLAGAKESLRLEACARRRARREKRWTAGRMAMTQRDWAKMNSGKHPLTIVQAGADVIACVWGEDTEEEAEYARLIAAAPAMAALIRDCPLPSTMGSAEDHYSRFYDWLNGPVKAVLAKIGGDA